MMKRGTPIVIACLVAGCAASHTTLPDGARPDGPDGARAVDGASDGTAPRECRPIPQPPNAQCTPERQMECQRWAESLTVEGYAQGSCPLGWPGWELPCYAGYRGCEESAPHGDLPPPCICDDRQCASDEVCVSDTPGGPARCRPRCAPTTD